LQMSFHMMQSLFGDKKQGLHRPGKLGPVFI
jgi:hypothetical protein